MSASSSSVAPEGWVLDWGNEDKERENDVHVSVANETTFQFLLGELNKKPDRKRPPAAQPPSSAAPRPRGLRTSRAVAPDAPGMATTAALHLAAGRPQLLVAASVAAIFAANWKGSGAIKAAPEAVQAWAGLLAPQAFALALFVAIRAAWPRMTVAGAALAAVVVCSLAAWFATSTLPLGPVVVTQDWPNPAFNCSGAEYVNSHQWKLCCYF